MQKKLIVLLILLLTIPGVTAQHPVAVSPEKFALMQAELLEKELSLTKKQHKKVYNLYLKEARKMQSGMVAKRPGPRPPGRESGGGKGPGGTGGGQGPGAGRPGMGQRPPRTDRNDPDIIITDLNNGPDRMEDSDEQTAAFNKKMKKILGTGQYARWQELEQERRKKEKERRRIEEQERLFPKFEQPEKE